jgi:ElaB/YqjD/DUF883 family membrane-anchored ribosome-binding protein
MCKRCARHGIARDGNHMRTRCRIIDRTSGNPHPTPCTRRNAMAQNQKEAVALEDVSAMNRDDARRELVAECRRLLTDTEALLERAKSLSADAYALARDELDRKLASLRIRYDELTDRAVVGAERARVETDRYVRENPWQSVAIAAAIGAVVGVSLTRR